jgi:2-amino-4-hydroxy-6-hydroxymethyldihydropteridine diphosphokinase
MSPIPQPSFINAVCEIQSCLSPQELLYTLQNIEIFLGKTVKAKEASRLIDLDLLLFGNHFASTPTLELPHPRWKERLFVLIPLLDLTEQLEVATAMGATQRVDLKLLINQMVKQLPHPLHQEIEQLACDFVATDLVNSNPLK